METGKIAGNLTGGIGGIGGYVENAAGSAARARDDSFAERLQAAAQNNDDRELKKACREFEAIMLDMMYRQMKATVVKSGLVESDPGRDIFESMYDGQLMEQASKAGSLGLAEMLYEQLSKKRGMIAGTGVGRDGATRQEAGMDGAAREDLLPGKTPAAGTPGGSAP